MKGKAQMEIMGLTIVVILITLGVLFGVTVMRKPSSDIEQEFQQKTIATAYLDSILGTNTLCHKATFRELIQDCAQGAQIRCDSGRSCEYVVEKMKEVFDKTFELRKTKYNLVVEGPGDTPDIGTNTPCPGELTPGIQYIATRAGTVTIRLELCG